MSSAAKRAAAWWESDACRTLEGSPDDANARWATRPQPDWRGTVRVYPRLRLKPSVTLRTTLNHSPEDPDQLFARTEPARNLGSGRFPHAKKFPHFAETPSRNPSRPSQAFESPPRLELLFRRLTQYGNCAAAVPGIAMVHCRFYDLPGSKATLISVVGKSGCIAPEDVSQARKTLG